MSLCDRICVIIRTEQGVPYIGILLLNEEAGACSGRASL